MSCERRILMFSRGVLLMVVSTFWFALMNVCAKYLSNIPVWQIAFFRGVVTVAVAGYLIHRAGLSPWGNNRRLLLVRGLAGTIALLLYLWTIQVMPLASAVTIQYLSPLFTVVVSRVWLGERTTVRQWGCLGLSLTGTIMVKGFDPRVSLVELAAGIASAVGSAVAYTSIRRLKDEDHPLVVVLYFPLVTLPLVLPWVVTTWVQPTLLEWAALFFVGGAATIAQVLMTRAFQLEHASRVSIITYLGTVYALGFGYFLFGETVAPLSAAGLILILVGVGVASSTTQAVGA